MLKVGTASFVFGQDDDFEHFERFARRICVTVGNFALPQKGVGELLPMRAKRTIFVNSGPGGTGVCGPCGEPTAHNQTLQQGELPMVGRGFLTSPVGWGLPMRF